MPIGIGKIGALGGKPSVAASSQTFNAPGTFTAAQGLEKVTVVGLGSAGSTGVTGATGNSGGGGAGGSGHSGIQPMCPPFMLSGGTGGAGGGGATGGSAGINPGGNTVTGRNVGSAGSAGNAGSTGGAGSTGTASSALGQSFPGGTGGTGGAGGNGGTAGNGGTSGFNYQSGLIPTAGTVGGGQGGYTGMYTKTVCGYCPENGGYYSQVCPNYTGVIWAGGGGAGDTNAGSKPPDATKNQTRQGCAGAGGTSGGGTGGSVSCGPGSPTGLPSTFFAVGNPGGAGLVTRAGGGGGGAGGAFFGIMGTGGSGGGRGNAGNAGTAGNAGKAANPTTFNCLSVTGGASYPVTVAPGGQVKISWNAQ